MGGVTLMKYYKDSNNNIYAFESDGSQDDYIPSGLTPITKAQADAIIEASQPAPEPKTKFTSLEYLDRFTQAEQELIVAATGQNVQLKLFYDRLLAATFIDLEDPRTAAGIDALIAAGLLDSSRKSQLLQPE